MNGHLVSFNDVAGLEAAIKRVLDHPESRERLTQSARGRSKDFAKEKVVLKLVSLFNDIHGTAKS